MNSLVDSAMLQLEPYLEARVTSTQVGFSQTLERNPWLALPFIRPESELTRRPSFALRLAVVGNSYIFPVTVNTRPAEVGDLTWLEPVWPIDFVPGGNSLIQLTLIQEVDLDTSSTNFVEVGQWWPLPDRIWIASINHEAWSSLMLVDQNRPSQKLRRQLQAEFGQLLGVMRRDYSSDSLALLTTSAFLQDYLPASSKLSKKRVKWSIVGSVLPQSFVGPGISIGKRTDPRLVFTQNAKLPALNS